MTTTEIMTQDDRAFPLFCDMLAEEINFNGDIGSSLCDGETLAYSKKILLEHFPEYNVRKTLKYFEKHGGYCDCEVLCNVAK